jgi:hypothetical protein
MTELLKVLQLSITLIETIHKAIEAFKSTGIDASGVQLHTSTPVDVSKVLKALV